MKSLCHFNEYKINMHESSHKRKGGSVMLFPFYIPLTAKVIQRWNLGFKPHPRLVSSGSDSGPTKFKLGRLIWVSLT